MAALKYKVELIESERTQLKELVSGGTVSARKLKRALTLLNADEGLTDMVIGIPDRRPPPPLATRRSPVFPTERASSRTGYEDPVLVASTDPVGTKLKLAVMIGLFAGSGEDLVNARAHFETVASPRKLCRNAPFGQPLTAAAPAIERLDRRL